MVRFSSSFVAPFRELCFSRHGDADVQRSGCASVFPNFEPEKQRSSWFYRVWYDQAFLFWFIHGKGRLRLHVKKCGNRLGMILVDAQHGGKMIESWLSEHLHVAM